MKPTDVIVAPECLARLGIDGLARVAASLHPGKTAECQTCVKPLGGTLTSLTIDMLAQRRDGGGDGAYAVARLHHVTCAPSRWNDSAMVVLTNAAPTFSMTSMLVTGKKAGEQLAVTMLNPGLDMMYLRQVGGQWIPSMPERFRKAGMVSNVGCDGWPPAANGITARIVSGGIQIAGPSEEDVYPEHGGGHAPGDMVRVIRRQRRLLFVLTHAINPSEIRSIGELQMVMDHPLTLVGALPVV